MKTSADIPHDRLAALLDIGSSKVACAIVALPPAGRSLPRASDDTSQQPRLVTLATQQSAGVKAGFVYEPRAVEKAIRAAVAKAERNSGVRLETVFANLSCGRPAIDAMRARVALAQGRVDRDALIRLNAAAQSYVERDGRLAVDLGMPRYSLDAQPQELAPLGAIGRTLSAEFRVLSVDDGPFVAVCDAIESCVLAPEGFAASGIASAYGVTTAQERRLGVTVIDIGAGCTNIATLADEAILDCSVLPIGAQHITSAIASAFSMPLDAAERIKVLHGSAALAASDAMASFGYPFADDPDGDHGEATRADLIDVIQPRLARQFSAIAERLARAPQAEEFPIVLTGGGAALPGVVQFAADCLGRRTRLGEPAGLAGLTSETAAVGFATVVGLTQSLMLHRAAARQRPSSHAGQSYFARVKDWVRASF